MPFACSICELESMRICVRCTKDACDNHICESCGCCSDCCDCDVPLSKQEEAPVVAMMAEAPLGFAPAAEFASVDMAAPQPAAETESVEAPASGPPAGVDLPVEPAAPAIEPQVFIAVATQSPEDAAIASSVTQAAGETEPHPVTPAASGEEPPETPEV